MTTTALEVQRRFLPLETSGTDTDKLTFSFSSEQPVQRYFGAEVLDHKEESVDLARLNGNAAPLLFNHDPDIVLGKVRKAWIENKRGQATIEWATNSRAKEVRKDVEKGILESISVGYVVNEMEQEGEAMRATAWQPIELSVVSIPADQTIGINRAFSSPTQHPSPKKMSYVTDAIAPQITSGEFQHEAKQFSIVEAAKGMVSGRGLTGREAEVNSEIERQTGRRTQGFFVPQEGQWSKRAYVAGTATAGGNLIETELLAGNFIEALRNRTAIGELGATFLPGLTGDVAVPRRSGDATAYWIGADNSDSVTESTGTFDQVTMSPKTIGCYSKFSHLMKLQSTPEIETLIRSNFINLLAEGIDSAAIEGSGSSNQPKGILNYSILKDRKKANF